MADLKPTAVPSWATDTNFSSGPKSGSATKVEPSSGAKAQGDVPDQPYRSERHNWLWNLLCGWMAYLNDLPNQPQFLGGAFAWLNSHTFSSLPALAAPVSRSTALAPMSASLAAGTPAGQDADGSVEFDTSGAAQFYRLPFRLPAGATLTGVTGILTGGSGACAGTLALFKRSGSGATKTQLGTTQSASGSTIPLGVSGLTDVATDLTYYFIEVSLSDSSHAPAFWTRSSVQWNDPGFLSTVG